MFGTPVGEGDPLRWRFLQWVWSWVLVIAVGYLTFWFAADFWRLVWGTFWPNGLTPLEEMPQPEFPYWRDILWIVGRVVGGAYGAETRGSPWLGRVLFFVPVVLIALVFLGNAWQLLFIRKQKAGSGIGYRRIKGLVGRTPYALVFLVVVPFYMMVLPTTTDNLDFFFVLATAEDPEGGSFKAPWYVLMAIIMSYVFFYMMHGRFVLYEWTGSVTSPVRNWWRARAIGAGGSAGFGGMFEEWSLRYKRGAILLGSSLYGGPKMWDAFQVGIKDDRHMLTIAGSRGGKGRSAIIPNLIKWPYSALVIDPKGTNAAVTAARRGKGGGRVEWPWTLGQEVFVVDPFEIVKGVDQASFNPLASIDVNSLTVTEDIELLADAIVIPQTGGNAEHFVDGARTIIAGVIAHLLTQQYTDTPSLLDVRKVLTGSAEELDELFGAMQANGAAGGLPKVAASLMENAGPNERGSFFTTVTSNMKWLDSVAMSKVLGRSDFDLEDLKKGNMTVYVVLPPHMLEEHKRFMRLFVNLSIREMSQGARSAKPVLFVLDEFFSLGTMSQMEKAAGLLGGYNVKLWPIVQNLGQLKELYPNNWETFFSNAGAVQVFAVNDLLTEEYLVRMLGKVVKDIEVGERLQRVVTQLRETEEMEEELSREKMRQVVFRSGASPLLLRRMNYDTSFLKQQYSHDPDQPKRWWQRA